MTLQILVVIAVGSTDNNDIIAATSANGSHIDVCAPGRFILSTDTTSTGYGIRTGTSMAAPHVSGLVSLLKGFKNSLSNDDIENIIKLSADKVPAMEGNNFTNAYGYGRINAGRALSFLKAPYKLEQLTAAGGTAVSTSSQYTALMIAAPGLSTGNYLVKRIEVQKTVALPSSMYDITGVWGRGVFTTGWSIANPNFGEGFCEVVQGSQTSTHVTLRTYVYEVYNILGQYYGYYPSSPSNVTFAYSVLGLEAPSISGPSTLCDQATYTISNLPPGAVVEWSTDYHCSILSGQGTDSVTIQREFTGFTESGRITAVLTVGDQEIRLNRTGIRMGTRTPAFEVYDSQGLYILSPPYYTGIQYRIAATFQGVMNIPVNDIRWMITPPLSSDLFPWEHSGKSVPFMAYEAGDYNIALRYYNPNECGWSVTLAKNINFRPGSGGITLHPNPASGCVVVAFKEDESEAILSKETEVPTKTAPYHIQLWLSLGLIKTIQTDQPEYQLDLTGVPPGFYYVHVIKDGQTHRRQLVVQ